MATTTRNPQHLMTVDASPRRSTIASYASYQDAERAVDWLSDQGFAVERGAIVGKGLRSVERVTGRVTVWRAALIGGGEGMLIGAFFALLFGIVFTAPEFGGLLLYSLLIGGVSGSALGALAQATLGGRRDFASTLGIEAERYEVQVEEVVAAEAKHVLEAMPARDDAR